jgi:hypothetical protein
MSLNNVTHHITFGYILFKPKSGFHDLIVIGYRCSNVESSFAITSYGDIIRAVSAEVCVPLFNGDIVSSQMVALDYVTITGDSKARFDLTATVSNHYQLMKSGFGFEQDIPIG